MLYQTSGLGSVEEVDTAITIEKTVESELCFAVPGAAEALQQVRELIGPIHFLSDMHLSSAQIRALLQTYGLLRTGDRLVVSGDEQSSKHNGTLFERVWPDPSQRRRTLHVGNNEYADGLQAARAGLHAITVDRANPSRFEQALGADSYWPTGPVIAGAARQARIAGSSTGNPNESDFVAGTQAAMVLIAAVPNLASLSFDEILVAVNDRSQLMLNNKTASLAALVSRVERSTPSFRSGILATNERLASPGFCFSIGVRLQDTLDDDALSTFATLLMGANLRGW